MRATGRPASPARAAGAPRPGAVIVEDDGLLRLLAEQAVAALGITTRSAEAAPAAGAGRAAAPPPAFVFVGLERPDACALAGWHAGRERPRGPLRVGYAARSAVLLDAHRLHGCCDAFLELRAGPGGAVFVHPPATSLFSGAGLTARESDVLLLLAAGFTTVEVAARLGVSASTARCHCRAVLRKLGAKDRRSLRVLLGGPVPAGDTAAGLCAGPPREAPGRQPSASNTSPVSSLG